MEDKLFNFVLMCFSILLSIAFGGNKFIFAILVMLMAIDYILGVVKAYKLKRLSSNIGFLGITKKTTIVLVVGTVLFYIPILGYALCYYFILLQIQSIGRNFEEVVYWWII